MGSVVQYLERDPFERLSTTTTIQHQNNAIQHQNTTNQHLSNTKQRQNNPNQHQNNLTQSQASTNQRQNNPNRQTSASSHTKSTRPSSAPPGSMCHPHFPCVYFIFHRP